MIRLTQDQVTIKTTLDEMLNVTVNKNGKSVTYPVCEIYIVVTANINEFESFEANTRYKDSPSLLEVAFDYEEIQIEVFDHDGNTVHKEHVDIFQLDQQTRQAINLYCKKNAF